MDLLYVVPVTWVFTLLTQPEMFSSTSRLYLAALDTVRQLKVTFFGGFVKI